MEKIIFVCFVVSVGGLFRTAANDPRHLRQDALFGGALLAISIGDWIGFYTGCAFAAISLLASLPFRLFSLFYCEAGSGAWWKIWAIEQLAKCATICFIFKIFGV